LIIGTMTFGDEVSALIAGAFRDTLSCCSGRRGLTADGNRRSDSFVARYQYLRITPADTFYVRGIVFS
jgi:hypothetical protein